MSDIAQWDFNGFVEATKFDVEFGNHMREHLTTEADKNAFPQITLGQKLAVIDLNNGSMRRMPVEELKAMFETACAHPDKKAHQIPALKEAMQAIGAFEPQSL